MKLSRGLLIAALVFSVGGAQAKHPKPKHDNQPGAFDYYALSLSWAPDFCVSHTDPNECAVGKQNGFLLHGLWPQFAKGYPQSCSTQPLTQELRDKYGPVFASPTLINHEWAKHGTCSGLAPEQYFELTSKLKNGLVIPDKFQHPQQPVSTSSADFAQAFVAANPGMTASGVLPFCSNGGKFLQEVHVCYDKTGKSQGCSAAEINNSRHSCGQASFQLRPVR